MQCRHTVEYDSALKKSAILIHITAQMNFKDGMLKEKKPDTKGQMSHDSIYMRAPAQCDS